MKQTMSNEVEGQQAFQRHPQLPTSLPPEKDNDDYENFEDGEMLSSLWEQGEENYEDELMGAEDY